MMGRGLLRKSRNILGKQPDGKSETNKKTKQNLKTTKAQEKH